MLLHVTDAKYLENYKIWLQFNNGIEGTVELSEELEGEMFEPLKDITLFKSFVVDREIRTIVWENGADVAPEFLYENLKITS